MSRVRYVIALAVVTALGSLIAGPSAQARGAPAKKYEGSITVFAAASLTEAFTKIGADFEKRHPDTDIVFSFNSSSTLATQIEQGAPVDVFASADVESMHRTVGGQNAGVNGSFFFARNRLAIAVEPGNPKKITSLADTVDADVILVLCAPEVPCGKYALRAYEKAGVTVPDGPTAENAKATLSKVALGEADAAVVYVTDVAAAKQDVSGVSIPKSQNVIARYPIASLPQSENKPLAHAFVRYVLSKTGQRTLKRFGFLAP